MPDLRDFLTESQLENLEHLEQTLEIVRAPAHPEPAVSREELVEFVRCICEGEPSIGSGRLVQGQRAVELAAWEFYRRLHEGGEL
jgi:hypothetical protein